MTQSMTLPVIKTALLSVSDKTGLVDFARALARHNVRLLSTGGTARALRDAGLDVADVSDHTGFPEMMDGRIKTLHPTVHGGILARRDNAGHAESMQAHAIAPIDLVVVNLYPFRETVAAGADDATCIENIDIGGPAMVRSAAKNHDFVTIVTDPADYARVAASLPKVPHELRRDLAGKAYRHTAFYDLAIADWFMGENLRYGENPHQKACVIPDGSQRAGVLSARQVQGKDLSYNNINDTDAAYELVAEFDAPTVAIIKHANPCGVATADTCHMAYTRALACDPTSAFGGIIALNRRLDAPTAEAILKLFCEVIIAPGIDDDALPLLAKKPNVRVLDAGSLPDPNAPRRIIKSIAGGLLMQDADTGRITSEHTIKIMTRRAPTATEMNDMLFAFRVAKHVKSNAIVYAANGATLGIGAGQMSRIDSTRIAAWKAGEAGLDLRGSAVASDAFFPFADGLIAAAEAGATAIIQPGGSIRDPEVIAAANDRNLAMVFTGLRHFRH